MFVYINVIYILHDNIKDSFTYFYWSVYDGGDVDDDVDDDNDDNDDSSDFSSALLATIGLLLY